MDTLKEVATTVCIAATLIGSVYIICPDGVMSRHMKYIIGLIMLIVTVVPILSTEINIKNFETEVVYSASAEEMVRSQAEYIVKDVLDSEGIYYERISVNTDISGDGNIFISNVCVYGAEKSEKILKLLSSYSKEVEIKND